MPPHDSCRMLSVYLHFYNHGVGFNRDPEELERFALDMPVTCGVGGEMNGGGGKNSENAGGGGIIVSKKTGKSIWSKAQLVVATPAGDTARDSKKRVLYAAALPVVQMFAHISALFQSVYTSGRMRQESQ